MWGHFANAESYTMQPKICFQCCTNKNENCSLMSSWVHHWAIFVIETSRKLLVLQKNLFFCKISLLLFIFEDLVTFAATSLLKCLISEKKRVLSQASILFFRIKWKSGSVVHSRRHQRTIFIFVSTTLETYFGLHRVWLGVRKVSPQNSTKIQVFPFL